MSLTINSFSERVGCEIVLRDENAKTNFDVLFSYKQEIESNLGYPLDWQRSDEKKRSRIAVYTNGLIDNLDDRPRLISWLFDKAVQFHSVFSPLVQNLD